MPTVSSSSSPAAEERLVRVPLDRLHPHPANANVMEPERLEKLARNIERERLYPPLVVRPHPDRAESYQLLDGHQRVAVLRRLGHADALCYVWPCDDIQALLLLATLNRLEGADNPALRGQLLADLSRLLPEADLSLLLPEDAAGIEELIGLVDLDLEGLLADLEQAAGSVAGDGLRAFTVALSREDERVVEAALARAATNLTGKNRRGRALTAICRAYIGEDEEPADA